MTDSELHRFSARLATLPEFLAYLRQVCEHAGLSEPATLRIELVLEELFTNTVHHGYRGDSDAPVWLSAVCAGGSLCVSYQDAAPPHDPLTHCTALPETLDERGVGGLGIRLARELANTISYCRDGDRNVLTLSFQSAPR